MKIYLIRHGETDWNLKQIIQGTNDTVLNDTGRRQAKKLANKLYYDKNIKFSKVYTSKQKRAVETAKIIARILNKDYIIVQGIEEMNLGSFEKHKWEDVEKKFSDEFSLWMKDIRYRRVPFGESYEDVLKRAIKTLYKIIKSNSENVAIVTHGAVIMAIVCLIKENSFNDILKFSALNSSIYEINSEDVLKHINIFKKAK
ncbi:histidine phosphatase family protein [Clostridium sp. BJN0001]|uniref:histidine phosphatase family protein n=1 Tax=Clostridium sp. BJN0001 TaxID=2930219 RepID=UPI001FD3AACF|nr:histidine phosphatase family protein [Clostridium sp. BJN0001]